MIHCEKRFQAGLICLLLVSSTLAVFWPVSQYGFVNYDDPGYVSENPHILKGLTFESVRWAFTTRAMSNWHPVTWLSYLFDGQLFGANPRAFHVANLFLHVANTVLLFLVLLRMTGALGRSAFVAAAFAVHPLRVESVAWISERKDVLSAFFGLLAILAYLLYTERRTAWRYIALVGLFSLSLMAKPMLVTLPFILLLLDIWPLYRWRGLRAQVSNRRPLTAPNSDENPDNSGDSFFRLTLEKAPLLALAAAMSVVTFFVQRSAGAVEPFGKVPFEARVTNALVAYASYIGKTVWPKDLCVLYPHPGFWSWWKIAISGSVLGCATVLAVCEWRRKPYLSVGWLWYLGTLVPVIGLVQVGAQSMADRYTYLPSIGLFIMLAWVARDLIGGTRFPAWMAYSGASLLLASWAVASSFQLRYWKDSEALFSHAIAVTTNNAIAHYDLGQALGTQGRHTEARQQYEAAVRIKPDYGTAHNNLGTEMMLMGQLEEATNHFAQALRLDPHNSAAHFNFGGILAAMERWDDAISHYQKGLALEPQNAFAHFQLGLALTRANRREEAQEHFAQALRIRPEYTEARVALEALQHSR